MMKFKATDEMVRVVNSLPKRYRADAMRMMEGAFADAYAHSKRTGDFWDAEDEEASCTYLASAYACDEAQRYFGTEPVEYDELDPDDR